MSLGLPSVKHETEEHVISQNQNMEIPQEKNDPFSSTNKWQGRNKRLEGDRRNYYRLKCMDLIWIRFWTNQVKKTQL